MPVRAPVISEKLEKLPLTDTVTAAAEEGDTVKNALFEDDILEEARASVADFSGCVFRRVTFAPCDIDRIHFMDCRLISCDLSGFTLREGTLRRVRFEACRGTGMMLRRMSLRNVTFDGCLLRFAGFVECKLQDAAFLRCEMPHALLHGCAQKGLTLEECNLEEAEIVETRLSGVDLSTCDLGGLRSAIQCLEGTEISLAQAPAVLGLCGVRVY